MAKKEKDKQTLYSTQETTYKNQRLSLVCRFGQLRLNKMNM